MTALFISDLHLTPERPAVTGALQRLTDSGEHYVVFLEGHGERSLQPSAGGADEGGAEAESTTTHPDEEDF